MGAGMTPSAGNSADGSQDRAPVNVNTGDSATVVGGSVSGGSVSGSGGTAASGGLQVPSNARLAALQGVGEVPSGRPTESDGPSPHPTTTLVGPSEIKVGDEFTVTLQLQTDQNIGKIRSQVRYDAAAFQLLSGDPGGMVPDSIGAKVSGRAGGAQLDVTAPADQPLSGSGELMVLRFKAVAARPQTAFAAQVTVMGGSGAIMASSTPTPLTLAVTN